LANKRLAAELDERARIEQQLRDAGRELTLANLHLDAALNNISHGLCMFDANKKVVVSNQRFAEIYRIAPEQAEPGTTLDEIEAACKKQRTFGGSWSQERLGNTPIAHAEVKHLQDGRVISVRREVVANVGWMTSHEDITERHRGELKMAYMARHDLLTGLLNRAAFHEKAQEAAARLRGCDMTFSVILLDIDRFKQVNDSLGHPAGDALLREAALRLKASIGETDVLARLGGDEFAILQTTTSQQRDEAVAFARRIVKMFVRPFEIEGQTLVVSTSVGIALAAEHGVDPDELIKNADLALYRAKGEGRNRYTIFEPEMMQSANARHQLETDLRLAIENGELELYYQPQIEANTGKIAGAEALLRWHHPRKGFIPPDQFIPIAEETGLIVSIGEWALRTACAEARRWPSDRKVAVNLSPVQFRSGDLLATILVALAETGLPPERLEVEITENVLLESAVNNLTTIESLRRLGISIALDDFGTGYSSLNYLTMFPFDRIKIDRVFAMNLMSRSECAAIISSIITLGRGLGIATLAEGVETRQQFELLRAAGVDHCQGFLFGRPVPASALYLTGSSQVTSEPEVA
jgi:diguanylate cyclase (GGDEF)-like protein